MSNIVCRVLPFAAAELMCPAASEAQDTSAGQQVFQAQCGICHSAEPSRNLAGPSLHGVAVRPSGQMAGFAYSAANRNSWIVWTPETLDLYLTSPKGGVPHNFMTCGVLKDARKRADLIAYLMSLR